MEDASGPGGFASVLRALRQSRSLTQEELAERSGLTAKAIGALERGERRRPYPHTVRSLADGLGLDAADRARLVAAATAAATESTTAAPQPGPDAAGAVSPVPPVPPVPDAPLIGRDGELGDLLDLLSSGRVRLVTLTGPGGVGKTRLATEVMQRVADTFGGGATFIDLAAVREPALVLPRIASALGVAEGTTAAEELLDRVVGHLTGRRVLLVLDNLEQVLAAAPRVADLVALAGGLTVLATSRAPLRIRAEREVPLDPLAIPQDDDSATVLASPAVALFVDRATAAGARVDASAAAPALAAIARLLDGLPLALELAAAGARVLPPEALLARLRERGPDAGLDGPRDLPARQRTMTAVLDWSVELLEPEEAGLLARLAVFSGGFSLDSVEAVVASLAEDGSADDVLPALTSLVQQSLVVPVATPDGVARFRLLEPVRQYAAVRAHATGLSSATASAHAEHFHHVALAAHRRLWGGDTGPVLDRLEADHANLRSAFLRLLELERGAEAAELAGSLWLHLALRGYAREGLGWLDRLDGLASDDALAHRAVGRMGLLLVVGDVAGMRREAALALPVAARVGDPVLLGEASVLAGLAAVFAGDLEEGRRLLGSDLRLPDEAGRRWMRLHARIGLGQAAMVGGDLATAGELLEESLAQARALGNEFAVATTLNTVATLRESVGDDRGAAALLGESLEVAWPLRLSWTLGYAVPALAGVAARAGQPVAAATLFGAAATLGAASAVDPQFPPSRDTADAGLAVARVALPDAEFVAAWEVGRSATPAEVAELAAWVVADVTSRAHA